MPLIFVAAAGGWITLWPTLRFATNPPGDRDALIGRDLSFMTVKQLREAIMAGKQIGFVGDAQAFLYRVPVGQLHYRSVFDVTPGVADPIEAWLGPNVRGNPDWFLAINPSEVKRLHDTYRNMPTLPESWRRHGPLTFFVNANRPDEIIEPESAY